MAGELEDVKRELSDCQRKLDHLTRELAARRAALEVSDAGAGPESQPLRDPAPEAGAELSAALSELRSKLAQALSSAGPARPKEAGPPNVPERGPEVQETGDAEIQETAVPLDRPPAGEPIRLGENPEGTWFATALRRLAEEDSESAGRVLVSMLPAQAIATPRAVVYDLIVEDDAIYAVDAHPLDTHVRRLEEPRPLEQTDAWLMGTRGQLGELIVDGKAGLSRRLHRHGVKVKGQRARLGDLIALAMAPLRLRDLCAVGALVDPHQLLQMIVSSIDPSWISPLPGSLLVEPVEEGMQAFSFRIQDGTPVVRRGAAAAAADAGEPITVTRGSARSLMRLLAGLPSPQGYQAAVVGPMAPLEVLQGWVSRLELSSL